MGNFITNLWGQQTTGHGLAAAFGILAAASSGQMSWHVAIPALVGSACLIFYPENPAVATDAQAVATNAVPVLNSAEALVAAFAAGIHHGTINVAAAQTTPAPAPAPVANS